MLDRELLRRQPDLVREGIRRKGLDEGLVDAFLEADARWREVRAELETVQAEGNRIAKGIGALMAQGKKEEAEAAKAESRAMKERAPALEADAREAEAALRRIELELPNLPQASVPEGRTEEENVVVREWGAKPEGEFVPHWEIAERLGLIDLPRGAKISGSGFVVYRGLGARLQRALGTFMIDHQTLTRGYEEAYPPYLVNAASLVGTGNLPKFEEDLYRVDDDLYLIPTAEVPLTNLYRDEILDALPLHLAGFSGCFRREAGAAGKDTRGLLRIHQFDKVEMVRFVRPEESAAALEELTADAESVLQALGLHYRVIELCAGDLGAKGAKCYDVEVWSPGVRPLPGDLLLHELRGVPEPPRERAVPPRTRREARVRPHPQRLRPRRPPPLRRARGDRSPARRHRPPPRDPPPLRRHRPPRLTPVARPSRSCAYRAPASSRRNGAKTFGIPRKSGVQYPPPPRKGRFRVETMNITPHRWPLLRSLLALFALALAALGQAMGSFVIESITGGGATYLYGYPVAYTRYSPDDLYGVTYPMVSCGGKITAVLK